MSPQAYPQVIQEEIPAHTWAQTLFLHLAPGVANIAFTALTLSFLWNPELPPVLVFGVLTNVLVLIPIQLGWLFYLAKRRGNSGWSLEGVVIYRSRTNFRQLLYLVPAVLGITFLVFKGFESLTSYLHTLAPYSLAVGYGGSVSSEAVLVILVFNLLLTALLVPITEELYFRGYLLPRMPRSLGKAAPAVHSFLFASYHFDTPWMIPVRTLGLLPLIYATQYTRSVETGIITHSLANVFGVLESAVNRLDNAE